MSLFTLRTRERSAVKMGEIWGGKVRAPNSKPAVSYPSKQVQRAKRVSRRQLGNKAKTTSLLATYNIVSTTFTLENNAVE